MKQAWLILLVPILLVDQGNAIHPDAVKSHRAKIAQALANPNQENIVVLGELLVGSATYLDNNDSLAVEVHKEIQSALLAIPDHAEYYQDQVLRAQERYRNQGGNEAWFDYRGKIGAAFQIFPHLSSPEGVRALGELLSNDWVPPGNDTAPQSEKFAPLSVSARVALQKFPLVDKPFKDPITKQNVADANAAWLLWYEQIKSGNRTFRFEGDPTEYDLNGPAPKQKIERVERERKRTVERKTTHKKGSSTASERPTVTNRPEPGKSVVPTVAGIFLVLIAVGYFMLRRRISGAS